MRFHLIAHAPRKGKLPFKIPGLFRAACANLGVEYIEHQVEHIDFSALPTLGADDLVYRTATHDNSGLLERLFMNAACTSFYEDWRQVFTRRVASFFIHSKLGLPVIPSVPYFPNTEAKLVAVVQQLGDFPLIVKVRGGSLGVGIIRVDSLPALRSLLDYLRSLNVNILLRKYVEHRYYARLVVVGDRVVAGHRTYPREGEFRTNAGDHVGLRREAWVPNAAIDALAVQAVQAIGLETGGVDVLFDHNDQPFIAEVNFPNDFSVTQEVTGIDIAQAMVQHLLTKAEAKR